MIAYCKNKLYNNRLYSSKRENLEANLQSLGESYNFSNDIKLNDKPNVRASELQDSKVVRQQLSQHELKSSIALQQQLKQIKMNQWEDLMLTQSMIQDRTLFCEGGADEFVEIIKRKRGSE